MPEQARQLGFIQKIRWIFLPILNNRHICACLLYNTVPGQVQPRRPLQSNGNVVSICFPQNMEVVHNTHPMNIPITWSVRYIVGSNRELFWVEQTGEKPCSYLNFWVFLSPHRDEYLARGGGGELPPYDLHTQHRSVGLASYTRGVWVMNEWDNELKYISVKTLCAIQSQPVLFVKCFWEKNTYY